MERKYNVTLVSDDAVTDLNGITCDELDSLLSITDNQEDIAVFIKLNHENQEER